VALNELGREQARALADELADVRLDAIYASDLARARATAEVVAEAHGLEVRVDPRLRERSFGSWEGLTREDIAAFPEGSRHDGESDDEVRSRVLEAVEEIARAHPGEQVLVVSHGGALNTLWHHALGVRVERWDNCAVYKLAVRDDGYVEVD
jgi:2,3-bisphosphoglycerate-dependent phosphoglycerate mutase